MKVANIESLFAQLVALREAKLVASSLQIEVKLFRDRNYTPKKKNKVPI